MAIVWTGVGLVLLLGGGDLLVRGASGLARSFGVQPLVIGLTVVAFGTSAPELAVNLAAGLDHQTGIAFGNVIGSNLSNIGLILGLTALLFRLDVESRIVVRELPLMILVAIVILTISADPLLNGADTQVIDRTDGILLLLFFSIFMYTVVGDVVRNRPEDPLVDQAIDTASRGKGRSIALQISMTIGGLAALILGGDFTTDGASEIARDMGVPDHLIGLTMVAIGTSLPELVTCLLAARRGEVDLAVGNVVGSNLFNGLFILGTTATIFPVPVPPGGLFDLGANLLFSIGLLVLSWTHRRQIVRREGLVLLIAWGAYIVWRFLG
ncbi:MAG: calcium/sodium antiporter [Planctomycetota bacterium]